MKGRWRYLRYDIKLYGISNCDKIQIICCDIHNMLLEIDELSKQWQNSVPSVHEEDIDNANTLLFSLKHLAKPNQPRMFDLSKVRDGNDVQ